MMLLQRTFLTFLSVGSCFALLDAHAEVKPIRALLIAGGCCHDYPQQKKLLTEGISARANVVWSVVHEGDGTTDHRVSLYNDPDWSKNYDVVVHDECFSDVKDAAFVRNILKPHREGLPAVNLHCAMHSYRVSFDDFKEWFEFTGIDSRAHGPHLPIALYKEKADHPILHGLTSWATNWSTGNEELYNALEVWPKVTPLIYGQQEAASNVVAWVNDYRGTRVFSTTLGHNNATVADPRYLDLVTRGLLWSVDKLNPTFLKPAAKQKAQKMVRVPVNLALNKKVSASASEPGHAPEMATDDNSETRWCAPDNDNNYSWQVDLGKPEEIVGVRISWEKQSAGYQYTISGSSDGATWKTLLEEKKGPRPGIDEQKVSANDIRHVKITITEAPPGAWASFFEFEVLGKETVEKAASLFDPRLNGMQSPAGFEQSYFAGPPNISYPTCLEATPWGDVFVGVDQNGSLDREKNRGWVVRCRDTNADGTADEFVTFAKMDSPRGLVFDNKTLYVMHPPFLSAFHDDTGDGVADRSEVLVKGLGKDLDFRGADHTCNGVRMGIDGFLYIALGDYGALNATGKDGKEIQVHGGGIVRVRPDGTDLEVVVVGTRNIYDVAIDPFMNMFTCDNTNDGDEWNLRLSHMIPTAHYGYPSLYKHFANETMPTMKDFGGGSPTGTVFLDEPGFARGLYTCQWGWNNVSHHRLQLNGATFTPDKNTFVRIPRPTGIALDGLGNMYVASWKNGEFHHIATDVGFVARVSPFDQEQTSFPNLSKLSPEDLAGLLAAPSATRRLHVQREILRRPPTPGLIKSISEIATGTNSFPARAAAIFTLGQIALPEATTPLLQLSRQPIVGEFALRALADSKVASKTRAKIFSDALGENNPRVRLQAIIALNRLGRTEVADRLLPLTVDPDPAVSHAAFRALVSFRSTDLCLNAVEKADAPIVAVALRVLGNIHEMRVVEGLITRLESAPQFRMAILETLCRLYYREDNWDGSWWSTRPDSSGPYFKPVTWEGTPAIIALLEKESEKETELTHPLFGLIQKYKIEKPSVPPTGLGLLIADTKLDITLRRRALQKLVEASETDALKTLAKCDPADKFAETLTEEFIRHLQQSKNLQAFAKISRESDVNSAILASAILIGISRNTNAPAAQVSEASAAIADLKQSSPLQQARNRFFPLALDAVPTRQAKNDPIGKIPYEGVLKLVTSANGDANVGKRLFESTGCIKCHTVSATEPPSGPFLGDISARYSIQEILESILKPNAKIAQGFETTALEVKQGESVDGFVVRESGDELELRNLAGSTIVPKKNIANRTTRPTSIMPEGLVDQLSPDELASLVHYLRSLRVQ